MIQRLLLVSVAATALAVAETALAGPSLALESDSARSPLPAQEAAPGAGAAVGTGAEEPAAKPTRRRRGAARSARRGPLPPARPGDEAGLGPSEEAAVPSPTVAVADGSAGTAGPGPGRPATAPQEVAADAAGAAESQPSTETARTVRVVPPRRPRLRFARTSSEAASLPAEATSFPAETASLPAGAAAAAETPPPAQPPSLFGALFRTPAAVAPTGLLNERSRIDALIAQHARLNGVPEALVHRIVVRESRYNPRAVGRGGAMGLMQIKTGTARALGYSGGPQGLLDAETNLTYAVRYLAGAYRTAGGNPDRTVSHYARGYYYAAKRQGLAANGGSRFRTERQREADASPAAASSDLR